MGGFCQAWDSQLGSGPAWVWQVPARQAIPAAGGAARCAGQQGAERAY